MDFIPYRKNKATIILVSINVLIYLCDLFLGYVLAERGAGNVALITDGEVYRLLTAMFIHSNTQHLLSNMLILYVMGSVLESEIGAVRYLLLYFGGGLLASVISYRYYLWQGGNIVFLGASGAIFGIVGAVLYFSIRNRGQFAEYSTRQLLLYIAFSLVYGFTTEGIGNIAHISGLIGGFIIGGLLSIGLAHRRKRS